MDSNHCNSCDKFDLHGITIRDGPLIKYLCRSCFVKRQKCAVCSDPAKHILIHKEFLQIAFCDKCMCYINNNFPELFSVAKDNTNKLHRSYIIEELSKL